MTDRTPPQSRALRGFQVGVLLSAVASLLSCDEGVEVATDAGFRKTDAELEDSLRDTPAGATLVYGNARLVDGDQVSVGTAEIGDLDIEQQQRVARPAFFSGEDTFLEDEAWAQSDGETVESGYRVLSVRNEHPTSPRPPKWGAPTIGDDIQDAMQNSDPDETVQVILEVRNFAEWDIPTLPFAASLSAAEYLQAVQGRADKIEARRALSQSVAHPISEHIERLGGEVLNVRWGTGSIRAEVPLKAIDELGQRTDLETIRLRPVRKLTAQISLGDALDEDWIDADRFHANGFIGEYGNSAFHGYDELVGAVIDTNGLPSNPCFTMDARVTPTHNCTASESWQRLTGRWECDTSSCTEITGSDDFSAHGNHGTKAASIMLGDYDDCQGYGRALGDAGYSPSSPCHSSTWQQDSSGVAREARLVYVAMGDGVDPNSADTEEAIDMLIDEYPPDVINMSYRFDGCDPASSLPGEDSAEDAYDQGVFVVASAGNNHSGNGCTVNSPADTPKVWSVNSVDDDCTYNECPIDSANSNTGGADVEIGDCCGSTEELAIIDSAAPSKLTHKTGSYGTTYGEVYDGDVNGGSSFAAPLVAGAVLIVKDAFLQDGRTWVNNPGRLYSIMMAMHDRHKAYTMAGTSWRASSTTSKYWGLGRLKLRLFRNAEMPGSWGWIYKTKTFSVGSTSEYYKRIKSTGLPDDLEVLKCTMFQEEDMSGKDYVNDIELRLYVSNDTRSSCSTSPSGSYTTRSWDTGYNLRKFVSYEGTLDGRCAWVGIDPDEIDSTTSTYNFCYYASVLDDEAQY